MPVTPSLQLLPASSAVPTPWVLPPGMRTTRATRALAALFTAAPHSALSQAEVEAALATAGAPVNSVTVYRMLGRFAAAGLLQRQVDAARVTRYLRAPEGQSLKIPRFECDGCHCQFRLAEGTAKVQNAMKHMLHALALAGHESLAVDIAVRGRCAACAHPTQESATP